VVLQLILRNKKQARFDTQTVGILLASIFG